MSRPFPPKPRTGAHIPADSPPAEILRVSDIRASGQCRNGIKAAWKQQCPPEWGTYEHCLRHGVDLELAAKSHHPLIMAGVKRARLRIAGRKARQARIAESERRDLLDKDSSP